MDQERGTVQRVEDGFAWIKPEASFACDNCNMCRRQDGVIRMANQVNAQVGDTVFFTIDLEALNKSFVLSLGGALVLAVIGLLGGYYLAGLVGLPKEMFSLLGGALMIGLAFLLLRRKKNTADTLPVIVQVVKEES